MSARIDSWSVTQAALILLIAGRLLGVIVNLRNNDPGDALDDLALAGAFAWIFMLRSELREVRP